MRPFMCGWVDGWIDGCVCTSVTLYLVDTIVTTVFARSLSNFTCKLWMMRGWTFLILGHRVKVKFGTLSIKPMYKTLWATLLIFGHRVKGQGQIWHSLYKTY